MIQNILICCSAHLHSLLLCTKDPLKSRKFLVMHKQHVITILSAVYKFHKALSFLCTLLKNVEMFVLDFCFIALFHLSL